MRRAKLERWVLGLVSEARLAIHDYGTRPLREGEIEKLAAVFNIDCYTADISVPALMLPPIGGTYHLAVQPHLPRSVRRYIMLHEMGHVLSGEADEPMSMQFEGPLPESEDVCDLFALLGIVDEAHISEGGDWLEQQIRQAVPLDDYGWQTYRIPRLAKKLPRVREMVRDLHGYF